MKKNFNRRKRMLDQLTERQSRLRNNLRKQGLFDKDIQGINTEHRGRGDKFFRKHRVSPRNIEQLNYLRKINNSIDSIRNRRYV